MFWRSQNAPKYFQIETGFPSLYQNWFLIWILDDILLTALFWFWVFFPGPNLRPFDFQVPVFLKVSGPQKWMGVSCMVETSFKSLSQGFGGTLPKITGGCAGPGLQVLKCPVSPNCLNYALQWGFWGTLLGPYFWSRAKIDHPPTVLFLGFWGLRVLAKRISSGCDSSPLRMQWFVYDVCNILKRFRLCGVGNQIRAGYFSP